MIKKLDKLIIGAFIGPFIITFFVAFFVLMMQTLWKYIDDLVGKGLDFITICKFLWYASASMLVLAMPIAILLSSIMTFGNLGERFELVAIKSSGISLLRFMRPLIPLTLVFCGITFLFANAVIPYANLKFVTLYSEIYFKKPAFDLKEGVFYTYIPNYAIKVSKKDDDGKTIRHVLIFEQNNALQDNCIVAEKGIMNISEDQNYLEFNLKNGRRYQEKGQPLDSNTEYSVLTFQSFKKLFDVSILKKQETNDSAFRGNNKMLSSRQLSKNIDSLKSKENKLLNDIIKVQEKELGYFAEVSNNTHNSSQTNTGLIYQKLIPDSLSKNVKQKANDRISYLKNKIAEFQNEYSVVKNEAKLDKIEWHGKFSLSLSCLILFFIGAPLGAIIRKGGLGMPLVIAIVFFLIYHLLLIFGQKFATEQVLSPFWGMWLPEIVLLPVGAFLTYQSMRDSQLLNIEFYLRIFKKK